MSKENVVVNGVTLTREQVKGAAEELGLLVPTKRFVEEGEAIFAESGTVFIPLDREKVKDYAAKAINNNTVFGVYVVDGRLYLSSHLSDGENGRARVYPHNLTSVFKYKLKGEKVL